MKVAYVEKIRNAEKAAMLAGICEDELIARAATALADKLEKNSDKGKILCVAGMGNNGSDVLEAACILHARGIEADVLAFGDPTNGYNAARREKAKELGLKFTTDPGGYAVIADGLFGVGLNREVEGEAKDLINKINASGAYVISADIPSDLRGKRLSARRGDRDERNGVVHRSQARHLLGEGRNYCGKLSVADIGVKCEVVGSVTSEDEAKLPDRKPVSHKGNYGRVKIIGGSETMVGALL
ncbi:MAG: NAD(P)H-hydrate epimerase [Christensenellales bacterium]